jgi:hypothetical protein
MTRGILIVGSESSLANAIEIEAAKRVEHFAAALIPNRLSGAEGGIRQRNAAGRASGVPVEQARIPLQWNPGSPISARTLVLAAENRLEHIDEAILVCAPPSIRRAAAELSLADIEVLVNDHIKGWFFLVRELSAVFREREAGTLALVYADTGMGGSRDDAADLLGPSALAAFQLFTRSLLSSSYNEPYLTIGFSVSEAGDDAGFAAFILKVLEEGTMRHNGKLHKYGKLNFFK